MKKFLAIVLAGLMTLSITSCGGGGNAVTLTRVCDNDETISATATVGYGGSTTVDESLLTGEDEAELLNEDSSKRDGEAFGNFCKKLREKENKLPLNDKTLDVVAKKIYELKQIEKKYKDEDRKKNEYNVSGIFNDKLQKLHGLK